MRQHPSGLEPAFKALVVDEPVDLFQNRLQLFGQLQIVAFAALVRMNFKDHGKHRLFLSVQAGTTAVSLPCKKWTLSRQSAGRIASRCIKWVPRPILMSHFTGDWVNALKSQCASLSSIKPSHSPRMMATGARTSAGS